MMEKKKKERKARKEGEGMEGGRHPQASILSVCHEANIMIDLILCPWSKALGRLIEELFVVCLFVF